MRLASWFQTFVRSDIERLKVGAGGFEVMISKMALHEAEQLDVVFEKVYRSLNEGGPLVFSVVHPVITSHDNTGDGPRTSWVVDGYFDRGPRERAWFGSTVVWHHRTIEDYVRLVHDHGFRLDVLSECEPSAELLAADTDELARRRRVPRMLLLGATRQ